MSTAHYRHLFRNFKDYTLFTGTLHTYNLGMSQEKWNTAYLKCD